MALVLSMNPFCEPEAEAPPSIYQPIWESEHCSKSCISTPSPPGGDTQGLIEGLKLISSLKNRLPWTDGADDVPIQSRRFKICYPVLELFIPVLWSRRHSLLMKLSEPTHFVSRAPLQTSSWSCDGSCGPVTALLFQEEVCGGWRTCTELQELLSHCKSTSP